MRHLTSLVLIVAITSGCAPTKSSLTQEQLAPVVGAPLAPVTPPSTAPSSGADRNFRLYPTTTGGGFKVAAATATALSSNQQFMGFTSDSQSSYALILRTVGAGIRWWDIYRAQGTGSYSVICSVVDDGQFSGGLQVTSTSFFIRYYGYSNPRFRQFSLATCKEGSPILFPAPSSSSEISLDFSSLYFGVNGSSFYLSGNVSYQNSVLQTYSPSTMQESTVATSPSVAGQTLTWRRSFAVSGSNIWATSSCGQYDQQTCLWKVSANGSLVGWGQLPADDYPGVAAQNPYPAFLGVKDAGTVVYAVGSATDFKVFVLDVSSF